MRANVQGRGFGRRPYPTAQTVLCAQTQLLTPRPYSTEHRGMGGLGPGPRAGSPPTEGRKRERERERGENSDYHLPTAFVRGSSYAWRRKTPSTGCREVVILCGFDVGELVSLSSTGQLCQFAL